jgi:segregation and condensation protein B
MTPDDHLTPICEAALLAAGRPLSLDELLALFPEEERPERAQLHAAVERLREGYQGRGIEIAEVGGGFRIQVRREYAPWVSRLWEEKPARYSRALLETLALIAYRQPITRGEIEEIRGVSVAGNIVKTLQERGWVRIVGHRDVPGRPALYATTREFLHYFGLQSLSDLPPLAAIRDLDTIERELDLAPPPANDADGSETDEPTPAADPSTSGRLAANEESNHET